MASAQGWHPQKAQKPQKTTMTTKKKGLQRKPVAWPSARMAPTEGANIHINNTKSDYREDCAQKPQKTTITTKKGDYRENQ